MIPTPYYLAIDPGKNNGWATFNIKGDFLTRGILQEEDFFIMLANGWHGAHTVIVESFLLMPTKAEVLVMDKFIAPQMIGAIKLAATIRGWEFVLQQPSVRKSAEQWLGWNYKSHTPDDKAAHAHGVKYLVNQRIITIDKAISDKEGHDKTRNKTKENVRDAERARTSERGRGRTTPRITKTRRD